MTARRLILSNKKLRGVSRRIRAFKTWAESMSDYFPQDLSYESGYLSIKVPILSTLVQGKQSSKEMKVACAQHLITAAYNIFKTKPNTMKEVRITCCIVLPDMFFSEICLYVDEDYFQEHLKEGDSIWGHKKIIHNRSLKKDWGLELPKEFSELGILRTDEDDDGNPYIYEIWYFGELTNS